MYQRYAAQRGWRFEVMEVSETGIGGFKEAIATISGRDVFQRLKFESGVHRVQRVPATEGSGRIHTSAATVAVLPEAEDVDVHIEDKDLRIDVFRSSGPGGQSVNTTDSAVRITHLPSHARPRHRPPHQPHALPDRQGDEPRGARRVHRRPALRRPGGAAGGSGMTDLQVTSGSLAGDSVTAGAAVAAVARRLAAASIAESRREARLLVALALGVEPGVVLGYPERPLDGGAQARLAALTARRAAREPYSRLAGRRQFWSLDLAISPDTLDPRPDSETLIEAALASLPDRAARLRILDFGTGSGCLLLALLSELPNAIGTGIDI